jgi:hypothetical protein
MTVRNRGRSHPDVSAFLLMSDRLWRIDTNQAGSFGPNVVFVVIGKSGDEVIWDGQTVCLTDRIPE